MEPTRMTIAYIFLALILNGFAGLAGGLLPTAFIKKHMATILAFAAGTLVGTAFLELLPEALESSSSPSIIMLTALGGFLVFFLISRFLDSHAPGQSGHSHAISGHSHVGPLILLGDAIHNITDGIAIAAAFLVNPSTGLITAIAVIIHELPQEISDYTILVTHGYSKAKALGLLVLVQLSSIAGAMFLIRFSSYANEYAYFFMAACAGGFLYIAAVNLLPELNRRRKTHAIPMTISLCSGIAIVASFHFWLG